jgi:hypothetical protein
LPLLGALLDVRWTIKVGTWNVLKGVPGEWHLSLVST